MTRSSNVATKRSFVDDGKMDVDDFSHDTKRCKFEEDDACNICLFPETEPSNNENQLSNPSRRTIIAKIYDAPDDVNLNDVVEVVGVLTVDSAHDETSFSCGKKASIRPLKDTTLAHVHVIKLFLLSHSNPLLPVELTLAKRTEFFEVNLRLIIDWYFNIDNSYTTHLGCG